MWAGLDEDSDEFWTSNATRQIYKDHMLAMVNRTNTLTGKSSINPTLSIIIQVFLLHHIEHLAVLLLAISKSDQPRCTSIAPCRNVSGTSRYN